MIRSIHWVTVPEFKVILSLTKHLTVYFRREYTESHLGIHLHPELVSPGEC